MRQDARTCGLGVVVQDADSDVGDLDVTMPPSEEGSPAWFKINQGGCCGFCGADGKKDWHARRVQGQLEMLCDKCYERKHLYKGTKLALGAQTGRRASTAPAPPPEMQSKSIKTGVAKQQKRKAEEAGHSEKEQEVAVMDDCVEDTSESSSPEWPRTEKKGGCCKQCGMTGKREWRVREYEGERQMLCDACYPVRGTFIGTSQINKRTERQLAPEFEASEELECTKHAVSMARSVKQPKQPKATRSDDVRPSLHKMSDSTDTDVFHGVKRFPAPCGDDYCVNPRLAPGKVEGNEYMAIENETVAEISAKLKVPSPSRHRLLASVQHAHAHAIGSRRLCADVGSLADAD